MPRAHQPVSPPDIAGAVKEAIGEYLFRRLQLGVNEDTKLRSIGICRSDLAAIVEIAVRSLDGEVALHTPSLHLDALSVGELIASIEKAVVTVPVSP